MIFSNGNFHFKLNTPKYEIPTFGGKMGELRSVDKYTDSYPSEELVSYLRHNDYLACTYRGVEDIRVVRALNNMGFKFVASYRFFRGYYYDFTPVEANVDGLKICKATPEDYDRILEIEGKVFDYSTYQIDPDFPNEITSYRNVLRVKSYFTNPDHVCYVAKVDGVVVGFIQFIISNNIAENVNSAILPEYHGRHIGAVLYAQGFGMAYGSAREATGWVCVQNPRPFKLLNRMGFKFLEQEIHLRWKK